MIDMEYHVVVKIAVLVGLCVAWLFDRLALKSDITAQKLKGELERKELQCVLDAFQKELAEQMELKHSAIQRAISLQAEVIELCDVNALLTGKYEKKMNDNSKGGD